MASRLQILGVIGAVLIIAGACLGGIGFLVVASASGAATNCELHPPAGGCNSAAQASLNASVQEVLYLGVGMIVGGAGGGCLLVAALGLMSRWPPIPPARYPVPSSPPPLTPPGTL